jgi:hypothetical protein
VRRARSEELKEMAEAIKALAEYMRTGFQEVTKRLDRHEEILNELTEMIKRHERLLNELTEISKRHDKLLSELVEITQRHEKILSELTEISRRHDETLSRHERAISELVRVVGELKVAMGSLGRRWGVDLERTVLEIYRDALERRGIEPGKVEKFVYVDIDGRYYRQGARLEIDVYIHDDKVYLIEVKSRAELDDVEWLFDKAAIVGKILGRKIERIILVAVNVDKEAFERANQLGIDVIYGSIIE